MTSPLTVQLLPTDPNPADSLERQGQKGDPITFLFEMDVFQAQAVGPQFVKWEAQFNSNFQKGTVTYNVNTKQVRFVTTTLKVWGNTVNDPQLESFVNTMIETRLEDIASGAAPTEKPVPSVLYATTQTSSGPQTIQSLQNQGPQTIQSLQNQVNVLQQQLLSAIGASLAMPPVFAPVEMMNPFSELPTRKRKLDEMAVSQAVPQAVLTSRQQEMAAVAAEKQRKEEEAKARLEEKPKRSRTPRVVKVEVLEEEHPEDIAYRKMIASMKELKLKEATKPEELDKTKPEQLTTTQIDKLDIYKTMERKPEDAFRVNFTVFTSVLNKAGLPMTSVVPNRSDFIRDSDGYLHQPVKTVQTTLHRKELQYIDLRKVQWNSNAPSVTEKDQPQLDIYLVANVPVLAAIAGLNVTAFVVTSEFEQEIEESAEEWRKNKLEMEVPISVETVQGRKNIKTKTGFEYYYLCEIGPCRKRAIAETQMTPKGEKSIPEPFFTGTLCCQKHYKELQGPKK